MNNKVYNIFSGDYSRQNFSCIYAIKSKLNGRCYVGSAKHFGIRRRNHLNQLNKNKHHSIILQRHANKYGIGDLHFEIIETFAWDLELAKNREQYYIDTLKPYFNISPVAKTRSGFKISEETRLKLRLSHIGTKQSMETREKRRQSCINAMKFLSDEQRENRKIAGYLKRKKIICNETMVVYSSIREAEALTGCDNISQILKGTRNHSRNLTFSYYEL